MKKRAAVILLGVMVFSMPLSACGSNKATEAANESAEVEKEGIGETEETKTEGEAGEGESSDDAGESEAEAIKVGVLFPNADEWSRDVDAIKEELEAEGYEPVIMDADGDVSLQISQIQELVETPVSALIITPVDEYSLTDALKNAKENSIPVFSYDRLVMNTDAINYYTAFDKRVIGNQIGEAVVKQKDLEKAREDKTSCTIEFLMGSPDDLDALFLYNGIMEILQPYLDDGTLVCKSARTSFDDTAIMRWSSISAENRIKTIISEFYAEEGTPDIICTAADGFTYGVTEYLKENGILPYDEKWPMITGMGSEAEAVKNVAEGELAFTVFMDRNELAEACVKMVDTYLKGDKPEVKDYSHYDNGVKIVGTDTCEVQFIDKDNYQILIDNGTYAEEEIEPEVSPTPVPEEEASETDETTPAPEEEASETEEGIPASGEETSETEKESPTPEDVTGESGEAKNV